MLMLEVLRLSRWEWFKVRRLRMPWILLAIAILLSQFGIWTNYAAYHNNEAYEVLNQGNSSFGISLEEWGEGVAVTASCVSLARGQAPTGLDLLSEEDRRFAQERLDEWLSDGVCDNTVPIEEVREGFTLPSSITGSMSSFASLGPIAVGPLLFMILAASLFGAEYGWGTLRTVLAGGIGRWKFLSAKLLLLLRLCAGALIVIALAALASSLIAALISPEETGGLADSGEWSDIVIVFFKAIYGLLPFIALSVFVTVLASSGGTGIAVSVGYFIAESIIAPLFNVNDTLANVTDYLLIQSFLSWTAAPEQSSDTLLAFAVMLAYSTLFIAATAWIFRRRDIGGAAGD